MPSRENMYGNGSVPEFKITALHVEELVSEIKENLRLSATSMKSRPSLSRKSSRASPYKIPARCLNKCGQDKNLCTDCYRKRRCLKENAESLDDPYELLQKLLQDGGLIQEAVRRVQLGLTPKQRYFYDSEEETCSPVIRFHDTGCAQESAKCN